MPTSTTAPPTITSTRPGSRPGLCARCSAVSVASVRNTSSAAARVRQKWWIFSGSYSGSPSSIAATVVTVPARPTSVAASAAPGIDARHVGDEVAHGGDRVRQLLGRGRIGLEELLGDAHASHVERHETGGRVGAEHELGGATTDVDDEVGRGRVEVGGGAEERQRGLLLAREQLGGDAERVVRGGEEVVAVRRVARRARWRWRARR